MTPALAEGLAVAWAAVVGACVGSFLNVVIARVPAGLSIVRPPSRCPVCSTPIRWYDNVPLISWLVLGARCRACRARIPVRYPLVEAVGAVVGAAAVARHGLSGAAAAELAFVAALVALAFIDLDTWLLPTVITRPLLVLGLALSPFGATPAGAALPAVYGAAIGFALLGAIAWIGDHLLHREVMGWGDVWLLAGIGAWLGPLPLLPVLLLASVQGTIFGLVLLALGRGEPGPPPAPPEAQTPAPPPDGAPVGAEATVVPAEPVAGAPAAAPAPDAAPAPAPAPADPAEDDTWIPPRHAVPFGPFLVAGALEWLWFGGALAGALQLTLLFR